MRNTKTQIREKTFYDTKVFLEFLVAEGERRKIDEIPPNELKNLAKSFVFNKCPEKTRRSVLTVFIKTFACWKHFSLIIFQ
jgi:hypothetical protein